MAFAKKTYDINKYNSAGTKLGFVKSVVGRAEADEACEKLNEAPKTFKEKAKGVYFQVDPQEEKVAESVEVKTEE